MVKKILFAAALIAALIPFANAQDARNLTRAVTPQSVDQSKLPSTVPPYCNPCLFYGGDWPVNALSWVAFGNGNEYDAGTVYQYTTYVPFVVPGGQTWSVSALFTNNIFYNYVTGTNDFQLNPNTVEWTINQGVTTGSGGTVVASGTAPGNIKQTGRVYGGFYFEYTVTAALTTAQSLPGGLYWLGAVGDCTDASCEQFMYLTDTHGRNHFGPQPPKCHAYQNGPQGGIDFENTCDEGYGKGIASFLSAGVVGTK